VLVTAVGSDFDAELEAMSQEREFLLRSLRDLEAEHDAGDIDETDYQTLRDDYTARAAAVLRAIEARRRSGRRTEVDRSLSQRGLGVDAGAEANAVAGATVGGRQDALAAAQRSRRRWRITAIASIVAIAGGLTIWAVSSSSGSRQPGQTVSGNSQLANGGTDPRLARAGQLVNKGKVADALKLYDQILHDDPNQPEALADEGWLIGQAGMAANRPDLVDQGLAKLVASEQVATSYAPPHFFRGFLLFRGKNDAPGAVTELRLYLGLVNPTSPEVPQVQQLLQAAISAAGKNVPPGPNAPPLSTP
jgi:hypothetical protein